MSTGAVVCVRKAAPTGIEDDPNHQLVTSRRSGIDRLDQSLPQRVRDRVRAVAEIQAAGHVVDDVLHRPLGQE